MQASSSALYEITMRFCRIFTEGVYEDTHTHEQVQNYKQKHADVAAPGSVRPSA